MGKKQYHHGSLKKDLISKGLQLLNQEGYEGLSLRKVADLCGVSNAAPYNHFKNKDELILAITHEVVNSFTDSLNVAVQTYPNNPPMQILELGRQYVGFMVENPDYLKFLFLSENDCPIVINHNGFSHEEIDSFSLFRNCAENYLASINSKTEDIAASTLSMWSLVHGLAVLLVNKSIIYEGDYLELVTKVITQALNIKL